MRTTSQFSEAWEEGHLDAIDGEVSRRANWPTMFQAAYDSGYAKGTRDKASAAKAKELDEDID